MKQEPTSILFIQLEILHLMQQQLLPLVAQLHPTQELLLLHQILLLSLA
jgi:hypothetical protein